MVLGSVIWILAAAWGWSETAWLYTKFGFHDWGAGVVFTQLPQLSPSACSLIWEPEWGNTMIEEIPMSSFRTIFL